MDREVKIVYIHHYTIILVAECMNCPQFKIRQEQSCKVACRKQLNSESAKNFKEKIDDEYRVNM